MQHAIWLASKGTAPIQEADRSGRGRAGGLYERADTGDRQEWNSDDEEIDEFGRKKSKKRRTGSKNEKPSSLHKPSADDRREAQTEEPPGKARSRPASSSSAAAMDTPLVAASSAVGMSSPLAMMQAASNAANEAAMEAAMQVLLQKRPTTEAQEPSKKMTPPQTLLITDRQQRGGKSWVPPKPISTSAVSCKFFAEGFCTWGTRCNFIHNPMDQLNKMEGFIDFETGKPKEVVKQHNFPKESNDTYHVSSNGTVRLKSADGPGVGGGGCGGTLPKQSNDVVNVSPTGTVRLKSYDHGPGGGGGGAAAAGGGSRVAGGVTGATNLPLAFQNNTGKPNNGSMPISPAAAANIPAAFLKRLKQNQ